MNASTHARPLGFWSATALVAGNMIGSGVFLLPASLAPFGGIGLYGWSITLGGALALALTFARLSARAASAGGPYAYACEAFGDTVGFAIAWSYWISIWCANAAIAVAFAASLTALFPNALSSPGTGAVCALLALWLCVAINLAGVREAGRMQIITTILKLLPLLLFGGVAIWWLDASNFATETQAIAAAAKADAPATWFGALQTTVALTLWSLLGLEAATIPSGAIENAERTVPRATMVGTLLAGIATILACTAVLGLLPADVAKNSPAPMAAAAHALWGENAGRAIAAVAAVSCFGALNGWLLLSAQLPMAAACDRIFPAIFARTDRNGTPRLGIVIGALLASGLVASKYSGSLAQVFTFSILLSTAATLLPYVASAAAWLKLGHHGRITATLALLYSVYALIGTGIEALTYGAVLIGAGFPLHLLLRQYRV